MTVANAGDVEAVLSRNNEVILLTRNFTIVEDRDELDRVKCGDGLITEVCFTKMVLDLKCKYAVALIPDQM